MPKVDNELSDRITQAMKRGRDRSPVWAGPQSRSANGGMTQSKMSRYVVCPERFRLREVEGLGPAPKFNHYIEFGNLWHEAEEHYGMSRDVKDGIEAIRAYSKTLSQTYPMDRTEIRKWTDAAILLFPIYADYWAEQETDDPWEPIATEQEFAVPYALPSGRTVYLRGKFDGIVAKPPEPGKRFRSVWIREHKTKSQIDLPTIRRQLTCDIQSFTYLCALIRFLEKSPEAFSLGGVLYNVVQRPLAGGKGSLKRKKPSKANPQGESIDAYYKRLVESWTGYADDYFHRFEVGYSLDELRRFERMFLEPVLENSCDDYEWWEYCYTTKTDHYDYLTRAKLFPHHLPRHYVLPYGVNTILLDGGFDDVDGYIWEGNRSGLVRRTDLFPELFDHPDSLPETLCLQ